MAQGQYIINFTDPENGSFIVKPYTSNGPIFPISTSIDSNAVSINSSLLLYGKGMPNFGERIQENIIHLLENFSGGTAPKNPIPGQMWFSRVEFWHVTGSPGTWYEWNGSMWVDITSAVAAGTNYQYSGGQLKQKVTDSNHPLYNTFVVREFEESSSAPSPLTEPPRNHLLIYENERGWRKTNNVIASETSPSNPVIGDLWFDISSAGSPPTPINQIRVYNGTNWQSTAGNYLELDGSTPMTGNLNLDGNKIINVTNPTSAQDVATKDYVDNTVAGGGFVQISGDTMTGDLIMSASGSPGTANIDLNNNNYIVNLLDPNNAQDAATKNYVDTADALKLDLSGGTLSGEIDMGGFRITNVANPAGSPSDPSDVATKQYVDNADAQKLDLSGGTLTGFLTLHADPTNNLHAATKQYVDSQIGGIGSPIGGSDDGVLTGVTWNSLLKQLTLNTSAPSTFNVTLTHTHSANEVDYDASNEPGFRDQLINDGSYPTIDLQTAVDAVVSNLYNVTQDVGGPSLREVIDVTGSPGESIFSLNTFYAVGANKLSVYVNGIKQIANERGTHAVNVFGSSSSSTGLSTGTPYNSTVVVDGVTYNYTINGTNAQTIADLIGALNTEFDTASPQIPATAVFDAPRNQIQIYSDASGVGSSVLIGPGSPPSDSLFSSMSVFVSYGTPVSIAIDRAYEETGNVGQFSSTVTFNSTVPTGAVVEVIIDDNGNFDVT